jgi:uncharacterized protein YcfL
MNKNLIIISGFLLFIGCSTKRTEQVKSIKDYYFPYYEFLEPQIYCYVNINDTTDKTSWVMQTKIQNGDSLFSTQILDSKNRVTESLVEKISNTSSLLVSYRFFNYDNNNNRLLRDCKIIDSLVFKWHQKLNENIRWEISFTDFASTNQIDFSKVRTLVQVDTVNKLALFRNQFHFNMIGSNNKYDYSMDTYYQKGKGLINYKLYLQDGSNKEYRLVNK